MQYPLTIFTYSFRYDSDDLLLVIRDQILSLAENLIQIMMLKQSIL